MKKLLFLLCLPFSFFAQSPLPAMLLDINPGTANTTFGQFSAFSNSTIVFGVNTFSSTTRGLWASDASTLGTIQLRQFSFNIDGFIDYNGLKYFTGTNGLLWRTDGTAAGTDSIPLSGVTSMGGLFVCNNLLFFTATTAASGSELWRTDGTIAGSFMVKEIGPGATNGIGANAIVGGYNNLLFFRANDNVTGEELWTSDGTTVGTNLLLDIVPGTGTSGTSGFAVGNNGVYFLANTAATGTELWFTNGNAANTLMLQDVATGTTSAVPGKLMFVNNYAYYFYDRKLYRSDGTAAGTTSLAVPVPTAGNFVYRTMLDNQLRLYNNELYYAYVNAYQITTPIPYTTDTVYFGKVNLALNTASIVMKTNVGPGNTSLVLSMFSLHINNSHFIWHFVNQMKILIFNPATMTKRLFSLVSTNGSIIRPRVINNKLFYPHGVGNDSEPGYIDLNNDSLYQIKSINASGPSMGCGPQGSEHRIYQVNGYNYILPNHPSYGVEFWETDFTNAGTNLLLDINVGGNPYNTGFTSQTSCEAIIGIETGNNIFFAANNNVNGIELWCFVQPSSTLTAIGQSPEAKAASMDIFPNPSNAQLNIRCSSEINDIEVFNTLGVLVRQKAISGVPEDQIDMSGLPAGMYVVSVKTTSGVVSRKIIKAD